MRDCDWGRGRHVLGRDVESAPSWPLDVSCSKLAGSQRVVETPQDCSASSGGPWSSPTGPLSRRSCVPPSSTRVGVSSTRSTRAILSPYSPAERVALRHTLVRRAPDHSARRWPSRVPGFEVPAVKAPKSRPQRQSVMLFRLENIEIACVNGGWQQTEMMTVTERNDANV